MRWSECGWENCNFYLFIILWSSATDVEKEFRHAPISMSFQTMGVFKGREWFSFQITNIHSWIRSRIPARLRTASVPRKAEKSVEFSSPEIDHELKRTRKKWKSFNCSTPINNNNVDLLKEWREELAEEQNIASLIQLSKDLLAFEGHNLGFDEIAYR